MDAHALVNALLEADEYVGDPMQYALDTAEKTADWLVPKEHMWVHTLRSLGFKLEHNEYTPKFGDEAGKKIEFWSAERVTKLKSGEKVRVTVSEYDSPELKGYTGVSIYYRASWRTSEDEGGIYGSAPIPGKDTKRIVADIIRRLERTEVEYETNSYTRGVQETINKVLKKYEYWENKRG